MNFYIYAFLIISSGIIALRFWLRYCEVEKAKKKQKKYCRDVN